MNANIETRMSIRKRAAILFAAAGMMLSVTSGVALAANIQGTEEQDILIGTKANDRMHGLDKNDQIRGLAGDDLLRGDKGKDHLLGYGGNDQL